MSEVTATPLHAAALVALDRPDAAIEVLEEAMDRDPDTLLTTAAMLPGAPVAGTGSALPGVAPADRRSGVVSPTTDREAREPVRCGHTVPVTSLTVAIVVGARVAE